MKKKSENDSPRRTQRKYHVTTKRTKVTKDSEIITFQFSYFVLFANFVVKCLFRFWLHFAALRLCSEVWLEKLMKASDFGF